MSQKSTLIKKNNGITLPFKMVSDRVMITPCIISTKEVKIHEPVSGISFKID